MGADTGSIFGASPEARARAICDASTVDVQPLAVRRWPIVVCAAVWVIVVASIIAAVLLERRLHEVGRGDLALPAVVIGVYVAAIMSSGAVGTALAVRRAVHPVGWSFVALATFLAAGLSLDLYARYGAVARPGSLPGADATAHFLDPIFLAFFASVAVVLHLTPTGRPLSPRWGRAARATVATAGLAYVGGVLSDRPIDPPFSEIENPLAVSALGDLFVVVREIGSMLTAVGLLVGAASLVVRFRRSTGADRQQLLWLVLAAAPLPLFVVIAFAFRNANNEVPLLLATGGWIVLVPVATGLSIGRYHLFDVDRILSRTFTYTLLSAVVVVIYASVVVLTGEALSGRAGSSTIAAVLGTFAAMSMVAPARRAIQSALDRRFNRRRFDALGVVGQHLRSPAAGRTIDDVLRQALGDPTLRVAYWVEDRSQWVSSDGWTARPAPETVEVRRGLVPVARLSFDESRVTRQITEAVAALALAELDNARLRAAISFQLVEVHESRARIATAQMAERRRIERNLHDGAQQRLLALGFELKAAQLNGDPKRLEAAVAIGLEQAHAALNELRDLANGLHPSVLSDGGLAAALDDLAGRTPGLLMVRCSEERFPPDVEAAAWFVICEAVSNAFKHAAPSMVTVEVDEDEGWLTVEVRDDGSGGANPAGTGLQGIRDRGEAAGGCLKVESSPSAGTTVRLRLPCGQ